MKALGKAVIGGALFLSAFAAADGAWAAGVVTWERINGLPIVGNRVGGIAGAGDPWSTTSGHAAVDLRSSVMEFSVTGLVLAGGDFIGTTGPITAVKGTLICDAHKNPTIISTGLVPLDAQGNANFLGSISSKSASCRLPRGVVFLITIPTHPANWIAYGAVETFR
jgi:hypothetical protein